jgi:hypothetical protein
MARQYYLLKQTGIVLACLSHGQTGNRPRGRRNSMQFSAKRFVFSAMAVMLLGACKVPDDGYEYSPAPGQGLVFYGSITAQLGHCWNHCVEENPGDLAGAVGCLQNWFYDTFLFLGSEGPAATNFFDFVMAGDPGSVASALEVNRDAGFPADQCLTILWAQGAARPSTFLLHADGELCIANGPFLDDPLSVH